MPGEINHDLRKEGGWLVGGYMTPLEISVTKMVLEGEHKRRGRKRRRRPIQNNKKKCYVFVARAARERKQE